MADNTILSRILEAKRRRIAALQLRANAELMRGRALDCRRRSEDFRLTSALSRPGRHNIIAEIKRASPSRGPICPDADVAEIALAYEAGGAVAISVLTEEDNFQGSLADLQAVRSASNLPLLRKDFVVSDFQIYESAANGADAILLIVAALGPAELHRMLAISRDELRMDAIVEVHSDDELETALDAGAKLIGVNNRDLRTFSTTLDISRRLIEAKRPGDIYIAESGIDRLEQIVELHALGFDGFLIGEALMRSATGRAETVRHLSAAHSPEVK